MIPHKQLTLAEVFDDCQNIFDNDKYQFLQLLNESINLDEIVLVSFFTHFQLVTVIFADKIHKHWYIRSMKPLMA